MLMTPPLRLATPYLLITPRYAAYAIVTLADAAASHITSSIFATPLRYWALTPLLRLRHIYAAGHDVITPHDYAATYYGQPLIFTLKYDTYALFSAEVIIVVICYDGWILLRRYYAIILMAT